MSDGFVDYFTDTFAGQVRPTNNHRPDRAAVGGLLANRGIDRTGAQFTDTTKPTGAQVDAIISSVASEVDAELAGVAVTDKLAGMATWLITLAAAATVEVTFFPEQSSSGGGTSAIWWSRYQAGLARFRLLLAEEGGGPSLFGSLQGTGATLQAASDYADILEAAGLLPDPLPGLGYGW
jgi:hypothetical protein